MDASKINVLIVEDSYQIRNIITYILKQNGFKAISSIGNSEEALAKLESEKYGIVISNWNAAIDGLTLLNTVRETPQLKNTIFIMVTSESDKNKIIQAKDQGVDGYVMKPFTAEALCNRIVTAIRTKYKDADSDAKQFAKKSQAPASTDKTGPALKVFGAAGTTPGFFSGNWSSSPSYLRSKPRIFMTGGTTAMMDIVSPKFDMMQATSRFVPIKELLSNARSTAKIAKKQTENAVHIATATGEIADALNLLDAPSGSPELTRGLKAVNKTAAKLSDMIDTFDKDLEDVMQMLGGMEGMVRQAHIHEINESIKASCELDMQSETSALKDSKIGPGAEKVAEKLARINTESGNARGALTTAAENIAVVIEKLNSTDPSTGSSRELFHQLSSRIDNIIDMLDSQMEKSATLAQEMEEVTTLKSEVLEVNPDKKENDTDGRKIMGAGPNPDAGGTNRSNSVPLALKKMIEYRILMIDLIKKDCHLSIINLDEMLNDKTELRRECLPGHPASSFSKWLDKRKEQKDYYDMHVCDRISEAGNELYEQAEKAIEVYTKGNKGEALRIMRNVNDKLSTVDALLNKLQDELRTRL